MNTYVALLRAVNVGGHGRLSMADLRALLGDLGFSDVRTYLQSGNAIFSAEDSQPELFATAIESALAEAMGVPVDVLVLSASEMTAVAAGNPFLAAASPEPPGTKHLHVAFLFDEPDPTRFSRLDEAAVDGEAAVVVDRVVYLRLPHGVGRTKLDVPRLLGLRSTSRNWNTVAALAAEATR